MTATQTSTRMTVENNTYVVTMTEYDTNGKPKDGITNTFNSQEEAEAFMAKSENSDDNTTIHGEQVNNPPTTNQGTDDETREKPASEMTEADAVALNADVHVATPSTDSDRVVTDGEKDQVAAGLHPKPESGNPEQKN
jgi:hypothetical protein